MPGFWDNFGRAANRSMETSGAQFLQQMARRKEQERQEALLQKQLQDKIALAMLQSKDSGVVGAGAQQLGVDPATAALLQRPALTGEATAEIAAGQMYPQTPREGRGGIFSPTTDIGAGEGKGSAYDLQERYGGEVLRRAMPAGIQQAEEKQRKVDLQTRKEKLDAIGKLPEHQRAAAYQSMDIDLGNLNAVGLSPEEKKSFDTYYKQMGDNETVASLHRINALYGNIVAALKEPLSANPGERKKFGLSQIAALNNLHKMSDDSVLRKDDVDIYRNAQGYLDQLFNYKDAIMKGQVFTDEMAYGMVNLANRILEGAHRSGEKTLNDFVTSLEVSNVHSPKMYEALRRSSKHIITMPDQWKPDVNEGVAKEIARFNELQAKAKLNNGSLPADEANEYNRLNQKYGNR